MAELGGYHGAWTFFQLEERTQDTTPLKYSFVCASARIHTYIYIWVPVTGCWGRRKNFLPSSSHKGLPCAILTLPLAAFIF